MITYDIKDLYVYIPIEETLKIARQQLIENNDRNKTEQIITCLRTILSQNYFEFQGNIYHTDKGIAMASPISRTVAKILLQYIENIHIKHLTESRNIVYYTRYVDDIFVIFDTTKTSIDEIQQYVDHIHKNLRLTIRQENNNQISFLDLLITRQTHKPDIDIYRKNTSTDTTISYTSNHPMEHKLAAYRSYINRMKNLPLSKENQKKNGKPYSQ